MQRTVVVGLVILLCFPLLAADPPLNVRDFGAKGDGVTDDTAAIAAAFEAAKKTTISWQPIPGQSYVASYPVVYFPNGRYRLSKPLTPTCNMQGEGNPILEQPDPNTDIISNDYTWRWHISGFTFLGGRHQLNVGNPNIDTGRIAISNCVFQNASGVAINIGEKTASTQLVITDCIFITCRQVLVNHCDMARMADTWITTSPAMKEQAVFENHGWLLLEHICGVPAVVMDNDQRWIDNYGGVTCRNVRFGGEDGGFTAVVNKVRYDYTYPVIPSYVVLEDCNVYCINNPKRRAAIWLDEVPNQVIIRGCTGFPDLPAVKVSEHLDLNTYFRDAEARGEACLRFYIDPAQVELRLRDLPEQMKKYEVR